MKTIIVSKLIAEDSKEYYEDSLKETVTEIEIAEGITKISPHQFEDFVNARVVTIPDSVTEIGNYAFINCGFQSIYIPDSVTKIGKKAFAMCNKLKDIRIPKTAAVASYAFPDVVVSEKTVEAASVLPKEVAKPMPVVANNNKKENKPIQQNNKPKQFLPQINKPKQSPLQTAAVPKETNGFILPVASEFKPAVAVKKPDIQSTPVKTDTLVANEAFSKEEPPIIIPDYSDEETLYISDSFENIPENNKIKKIVLGGNLKEIPSFAFSDFSSVETIEIKDNIEIIGKEAFFGCINLKHVSVTSCLKVIAEKAFATCYALEDIELPDTLQSIEGQAFSFCGFIKIKLPKNIEYVGNKAFFQCKKLAEADLACCSNLKIDASAFAYCKSLSSAHLASAIKKLPYGLFMSDDNLTDVTTSAIEIEDRAFAGCVKLKEIKLPVDATFAPESFEPGINVKRIENI